MKISFPIIKGGSGSDIYTTTLASGLRAIDMEAVIENIDSRLGLFPSLSGQLYSPRGADVIHANTWNGYAFSKEGTPQVVTEHHVVHDPVLTPYKNTIQRVYHRLIYRWEVKSLSVADRVVCVSKYTQKKLEETFGYSDSVLIHNGIDTTLFKPLNVKRSDYQIPDDKTILLYVGNLTNRKGVDLLMPIMQELSDDFLLLTTSGLRNINHIKQKRMMSTGKVSLKELVDIYNICDIFLFPSRLEGFGLSVAEAMSCGKPVITTDCSSLPELIIDDKGGSLCRIDDIKMFAKAVQTLSEDPSLRKKQGDFNRNRAINLFSSERMANEYAKIYKSL